MLASDAKGLQTAFRLYLMHGFEVRFTTVGFSLCRNPYSETLALDAEGL